jgi:hypothetical protein
LDRTRTLVERASFIQFTLAVPWLGGWPVIHGSDRRDSMAGNVGHCDCSLAGGVATKSEKELGLLAVLLSNALWIIWGLHDDAFALIALQICLAFLNIRGAIKNRAAENKTSE